MYFIYIYNRTYGEVLWVAGDRRADAPQRGAPLVRRPAVLPQPSKREFFIDNLLVRIHFIIEMIWWTGLAPWEFEFPFPGSLASTFQGTTLTYHARYAPRHTPASLSGRQGCETAGS